MTFFLGFTRELLEKLPMKYFQKLKITDSKPKLLLASFHDEKKKQIFYFAKFEKNQILFLPNFKK